MTFMFRYMPRENALHFFVSLFSIFPLIILGTKLHDGGASTLHQFLFLCICTCASLVFCHLAHISSWNEFRNHDYGASLLSWATTTDSLFIMFLKSSPDKMAEALFLFLCILCIATGILAYFAAIAFEERCLQPASVLRQGQRSSVPFREIGLGAAHFIAIIPCFVFSLEEADKMNVSLGWSKLSYVCLTAVFAAIGAGLAAVSRPDFYPHTEAHVVSWIAGAVGAMLSMSTYAHFSGRTFFLSIMEISGIVGALLFGVPAYRFVVLIRPSTNDYASLGEVQEQNSVAFA